VKRVLLSILVISVILLGACVAPSPTSTPTPSPTPTIIPDSIPVCEGIPWDEAKNHVGDRNTVYGPVVDTRWASTSTGKPTFLNIGKPYPDPNRFTVVIWIDNRSKFPEPPEDYYRGKTISATGLISEYNGSPQIEVTTPEQIEECKE